MGLREPVELSLQGGHVGRACGLGPRARDEGHVVHRDGMDPSQLLGHLAWERRSCPRELGSPHDAPADALALDARHDERFTPAQVLEVAVGLWNPDARGIRRLQDAVLVVERERVVEDRSAHRTADKQGERPVGGHHVDGPRFLGRASREERGRRDLDTAAQQVREAIPEVFCERRKGRLSLGAHVFHVGLSSGSQRRPGSAHLGGNQCSRVGSSASALGGSTRIRRIRSGDRRYGDVARRQTPLEPQDLASAT